MDDGRKRRRITFSEIEHLPTEDISRQLFIHDEMASHREEGGPWAHLLRWDKMSYSADLGREVGTTDSTWQDDLGSRSGEEETSQSDEDDDDISQNTNHDTQIDKSTASAPKGKLSQEAVVDLINEEIENYTYAWNHPQVDPKRIREEAEAAGMRKQLIIRHENNIEHFKDRIDKICNEIMAESWNTEQKVRRICKNLEHTVYELENSRWMASVYNASVGHCGNGDAALPKVKRYAEIIDLGSDSETEDVTGDVGMARQIGTGRSPGGLNDEPEMASIHSVRQWQWTDLEYTHDRKRIVSRSVYELSTRDQEFLRARLQNVAQEDLLLDVHVCIHMFWKGDNRMPGVLPDDLDNIKTVTKLYFAWWLSADYTQQEPTKMDLAEMLEYFDHDSTTFYDYLFTIMTTTTFSEKAVLCPDQPSQSEIIEISDDEVKASATPVRRNRRV